MQKRAGSKNWALASMAVFTLVGTLGTGVGDAGAKPQENKGSGQGTTNASEKTKSTDGAPRPSEKGNSRGNGHGGSGSACLTDEMIDAGGAVLDLFAWENSMPNTYYGGTNAKHYALWSLSRPFVGDIDYYQTSYEWLSEYISDDKVEFFEWFDACFEERSVEAINTNGNTDVSFWSGWSDPNVTDFGDSIGVDSVSWAAFITDYYAKTVIKETIEFVNGSLVFYYTSDRLLDCSYTVINPSVSLDGRGSSGDNLIFSIVPYSGDDVFAPDNPNYGSYDRTCQTGVRLYYFDPDRGNADWVYFSPGFSSGCPSASYAFYDEKSRIVCDNSAGTDVYMEIRNTFSSSQFFDFAGLKIEIQYGTQSLVFTGGLTPEDLESGDCFTPASFLVTTSMNTGMGPFYERLVAIFNRNHPVGLVAAIPDGHPGTFTPTTGASFAVTWDGEKFDSGFVLNRPFADYEALQLGSVTFTLDGCSYTGSDDQLR